MIHTITADALATLLEEAIDATEVVDERGNGVRYPVSMNAYRTLLQSVRESYDPSTRDAVQRLKPIIHDADVKGRLEEVIKAYLHEFIHDDRIQSAVLDIYGGIVEGFNTEYLLEHWLSIAIARGPVYAARAFLDGVKAPSVRYQNMTLLRGLRADREITVTDGIRLIRLPDSTAILPHYLPGPSMGPRPEDLMSSTILVVDASVSPVFVNPLQMMDNDNQTPNRKRVFQHEDASDEPSGFDTAQFCEALSLIAGRAVQGAMWWSHLDDDHICNVRTIYGGMKYSPTVLSHHLPDGGFGDIAVIIQEALSLYQARRVLSNKTAVRLAVPIDRWVRSHTDGSIVDKFIDLGIALESLYLESGNNAELRFRLALHAAWHLGKCGPERSHLMSEFRTIYGLRSKAVHTGTIADSQTTREVLASAQEHCRQAIIKFITDGEFPDWDRLVVN